MTYFKNTELAEKYGISESTVRNWIKMSIAGKMQLELTTNKKRPYVTNSPSNIAAIEKIVEANKKYRNSLVSKTIEPKSKFYNTFTEVQIFEIIRNLEVHNTIPRQYNYFDGGAVEWNLYSKGLYEQYDSNLLNQTIQLFQTNQSYIDSLVSEFSKVNVVDIGPGNGMPVKNLLQHLLDQNKLDRYIAIDISADMLDIVKKNIYSWFGNKVNFEAHSLDITHERFGNILAEDYLKSDSNERCNLMLFLGGTAGNLRNPDDAFRTIHESMNANDLLIYTDKLETASMRPQWFDYNSKPGKLTLAPIHSVVFDMLNIDESFYDVEMGFDDQLERRYTRARLKVALTLRFNFSDLEKNITFERGSVINLWHSWLATTENFTEQFTRNGFHVTHTSQTPDHMFVLTIAEVKK